MKRRAKIQLTKVKHASRLFNHICLIIFKRSTDNEGRLGRLLEKRHRSSNSHWYFFVQLLCTGCVPLLFIAEVRGEAGSPG